MRNLTRETILLDKFGKDLKSIRLKNQLTQEELARKAGLHRNCICMMESGKL